MKISFISDTHNHSLPKISGDILVHSGDATGKGTIPELNKFFYRFRSLDFKHKVFVAGNHDFLFQKDPCLAQAMFRKFNYLEDKEAIIDGLKFYGSPWQPWFHDWAFNLPRGLSLAKKWNMIPDDTDVLVTHGPPAGILDGEPGTGMPLGCEDLLRRVSQVRPLIHAFGHIHCRYGTRIHTWLNGDQTLFINASICTEAYMPDNLPIEVDFEKTEYGGKISINPPHLEEENPINIFNRRER